MRVLVWQWGRFGGGPRYALELSQALRQYCGVDTRLSMSAGAEILAHQPFASAVDLPLRTYDGKLGLVVRTLGLGRQLNGLMREVIAFRPDVAINTMPGYWDPFLVRRLRRLGIPIVTVIHDATLHPGDNFPLMDRIQCHIVHASTAVITLSDFVAVLLRKRGWLGDARQTTIPHATFDLSELALPDYLPPTYDGARPLRMLLAGRLKAYKGIDILAQALRQLPRERMVLRIAGAVDDRKPIEALAQLCQTELHLGWQSEHAFIAHLDWSDVVVLPYVEASQSGLIPLAYKRARPVIATPVGGLPEQIEHGATGLVAADVSAASVGAAIKTLLDDSSLLCLMSERSQKVAIGPWSWPQIAPRFKSLLEGTVTGRAVLAKAAML